MTTIEEQILQNAKSSPSKVALIAGETMVTYGELWDRCLKTADVLRSRLALKKGDRVIIAAAGNIEFVYTYFGVHIAGGICVPIDPDTNQTRFDYIYESTKPVVVLGMLHKVDIQPVVFAEVTEGGKPVEYAPAQMDDIADVLFTTGTTGAPKGVALSYKNVAAAAENINEFIQNTAEDVELLALPVSHSFGLGRVKCVLTKGGTLVMLGTFASMKKFFGNMEKFHCTGFGMVPAGWGYIKKMSGRKIGQFADQLRYIEIGSSFMSVEDKELLCELLPNTRICMHYGLTEASRSAFMEFHSEHEKLNTAGTASPNVEVAIFENEGKRQPVGEEGELCVKGEHVTCSYWNETSERFQKDFYDGYFRTGDCGFLDEQGYIHLKSRIKEMINVGGKKVSPREVEDILITIPGITESACVAIPDPEGVMGELVKAFIVCSDDSLTDAAILEALRPKLEVYKLPAVIERIAEIPKTASGKVQRLKLKIDNWMDEQLTYMDELFTLPAFADDEQQQTLYLKALQEELIFHYEHNEMYRQFCDRKGFDPKAEIKSVEDIPPVAVSVFKDLGMGLQSVPKENIKLRLQSSATSGTPSTIVVDKITSKRQAKAMVKVIQEAIGKERKPFLVMDIDPRSEFRALLGARFAAITGYLNFASKAGYFLKAKDGVSYFDVDAMQEYVAGIDKDQPVVVFGFTYILYSNVLKAVKDKGITIPLPKGSKIIHIGGWKKLESEKISKELFNQQLADCFGIEPVDVIDIYGFTEQMGLNYPDCPCGCKHESSYVKVLVRDIVTNEVLPAGEEGKLEFITPVPHSYPGNAVLTDDLGMWFDEPCPYGRPGKRFKILGRLKKAEVRGCGDILSNKLTFQKRATGGTVDTRLEVQSFHGTLIEGDDTEKTMQGIVDSLEEQLPWLRKQPIEALIGLIDAAAKRWATDPKYLFLKDKGLNFLATWCSERHLKEVATFGLRGNVEYADTYLPFPDSAKHLLKANSRGLCCHWMAGNVQILGLFALVQCIMTKNVNLLKVSSHDEGVFAGLLSAFEGLEYTTPNGYTIKGDELLKTMAVVYFSRNAVKLGENMSKNADVRIAWGGREAVETVAGYPSKYDCETVIFGPKLSFAVVTKEMLPDEQAAKKLARRVSVDVSVFDQTGCASAHNLFVEKGGAVSPEKFCEILNESMAKTEIQIPKPTMSPEQVSAIHSIRGVYDFCGTAIGSETMSYSILLDDHDELHKPVYSRVLFVHAVDSIMQSIKHITEDIQTIGIEATQDQAIEYAEAATQKGAVRFPQIGRMLNFEMPWDGIVLIDRLVKWNTFGGPLR